MKYISNAWSPNMIDTSSNKLVEFKPITAKEVPQDVVSAIGHPDTAVVVSGLLGFNVPCNRVSLSLTENDMLYLAQYRGPRLPEGATQLPEGATIQFLEVTIKQ